MKPKVRGADKGREGRETEKPGHLMSLNDPKWRYLLISSINFSCKISLARLARAYQPSDFTAKNNKSRIYQNEKCLEDSLLADNLHISLM